MGRDDIDMGKENWPIEKARRGSPEDQVPPVIPPKSTPVARPESVGSKYSLLIEHDPVECDRYVETVRGLRDKAIYSKHLSSLPKKQT